MEQVNDARRAKHRVDTPYSQKNKLLKAFTHCGCLWTKLIRAAAEGMVLVRVIISGVYSVIRFIRVYIRRTL